MSPKPLPSDIAAFIGDHLLSLDEIEALTAMSDSPERWWDPKLMCSQLGVTLSKSRCMLDHLAGLNLLEIRLTDEVRYRLQPGTADLNRVVHCLVSGYRTNRAAVLRAIAPVARPRLLDFADVKSRNDEGSR